MANKPGRNDPCHCGSGKKYKRCCLDADSAVISRALAAAAELEDDDPLDDGEDWPEDDDWDIAMPFQREDVILASYARGLAQTVDQISSGEGFEVTEWTAPQIPTEILDVFDREAVWELDGIWGDIDTVQPIQYDLISVRTTDDQVVIEVRNRGAMMIAGEDIENVTSITRVCNVLSRAAQRGTGRTWISEPQGDDDFFEDGTRYDPEAGPNPAEWLELSETERIERIRSWHRRRRVELPAENLHAALHTAVENQIALEVPEVLAALVRLRAAGLTRHDAVHAIGSVLVEIMGEGRRGRTDDLMPVYADRLDRLRAEDWLRPGECDDRRTD